LGDPAVQVLCSYPCKFHWPYYYQFSPPLSSHTRTHSHFIIAISKEATSTVFCDLFFGLLLLKSYEKVMEASSALYFWDHHTPNQIAAKPTEALDTALVYLAIVAITKPCTKA